MDKKLSITNSKERILFLDDCKIYNSNSKAWINRILVVTGFAIYFLVPLTQSCSVCPPENFCPKGPALDFIIEYSR